MLPVEYLAQMHGQIRTAREQLTQALDSLDHLARALDEREKVAQSADQVQVVSKLSQIQKWCQPVSDEEARRLMREKAVDKLKAPTARATAANLRRYAKEKFGWDDEIFYKVSPGFDWQVNAPLIGPCYNDWKNASQWPLKNGATTFTSLVFWLPRLVPESCAKNVNQKMNLLAAHKKIYRLPNWCLNNFGSASYNVLLILEYFHRTGQRVPTDYFWVRSDTLRAGGCRLFFGGFDKGGLRCDDWSWDDGAGGYLGCFPSGVLPLVP